MDENGLPEVGDIFMTGTLMFNNGDHAIERPVVVVRAPRHKHDYVTVIQRSSTPKDQKGVDHPRDDTIGLNKDGRWVLNYQRSVRCYELLIVADRRGRLREAYLHPLVDMWERA